MKYWVIVPALVIGLWACGGRKGGSIRKVEVFNGYAQGTTFKIVYDADGLDPQKDIFKIFNDIDHSLSLWDSASLISHANKKDTLVLVDQYFKDVLEISRKVFEKTGGAFDPTVFPLVCYWGFAPEKYSSMQAPDSSVVDSLLQLRGFDQLEIITRQNAEGKEVLYLRKKGNAKIQLDFNGIAQGYTVDVIYNYLENKGFKDFLVEVGGEIRTKGLSPYGKSWTLGIDKPIENAIDHQLIAVASVSDLALASAGNYQHFYKKNGIPYSRTIDPATGFPVNHTMLNVSVLMESCAEADAYATAFMVMGPEKSMEFIAKNPGIGVYFIYTDPGKAGFQYFISDTYKDKIKLIGTNT